MALEVEGSNPFTHPIFLLERTAISCIILFRCYGPVAQLAEQGTLNPKVQGSNPCRSTMKHKGREHMLPAFFFCSHVSPPRFPGWRHAIARLDGRSPTARFAVFTARSLRPRLCSSHAASPLLFSPRCEGDHHHEADYDDENPYLRYRPEEILRGQQLSGRLSQGNSSS